MSARGKIEHSAQRLAGWKNTSALGNAYAPAGPDLLMGSSPMPVPSMAHLSRPRFPAKRRKDLCTVEITNAERRLWAHSDPGGRAALRAPAIWAVLFLLAFQSMEGQETAGIRNPGSCDPCVIRMDTVSIIPSTDSVRVTGTIIFEKVGSHYAMTDLLEGVDLKIYDSAGRLVRLLPDRQMGESEFGWIQDLQAVSEDSVAVFDAKKRRISVLALSGGFGRHVDLPNGIAPGGGLLQDGYYVTAPSLQEESGRITVRGPEGEYYVRSADDEDSRNESGIERLRIPAHGTAYSFWLLHFLSYKLEQFDLRTGMSLREIIRDPTWIRDTADQVDWRYASLVAAFQPSPDLLWVLGRSNDPGYSLDESPAEPLLAGRESAWNLELDLISLSDGQLLTSLSLPYWIGGFTSQGLLFFFDEQESDWGQMVVVQLELAQK